MTSLTFDITNVADHLVVLFVKLANLELKWKGKKDLSKKTVIKGATRCQDAHPRRNDAPPYQWHAPQSIGPLGVDPPHGLHGGGLRPERRISLAEQGHGLRPERNK